MIAFILVLVLRKNIAINSATYEESFQKLKQPHSTTSNSLQTPDFSIRVLSYYRR